MTDDMEKALAKVRLDQSGFDSLRDELGASRDASLRRDTSVKKAYEEGLDETDKNKKNSEYLKLLFIGVTFMFVSLFRNQTFCFFITYVFL